MEQQKTLYLRCNECGACGMTSAIKQMDDKKNVMAICICGTLKIQNIMHLNMLQIAIQQYQKENADEEADIKINKWCIKCNNIVNAAIKENENEIILQCLKCKDSHKYGED